MPMEEDKDPKPIADSPGNPNVSRAAESNIETPEEEKRRKLQMLDNMVTAKIDEKMEALKQEINQQFQNFFAQIQNTPQQNTQQTTQQTQTTTEMPAEVKAEVISKVGASIAEVVKAWKGATGTSTDDYFGTMSKNMMLQIIQAGLDGIFKNVYPTYNPAPPNVVRFEPQIPGQQTIKPGKLTFE